MERRFARCGLRTGLLTLVPLGAAAAIWAAGASGAPGRAAVGAGEQQIALVRVGTGNPPRDEIVVMDRSGRRRRVLVTPGEGGESASDAPPAWSPDGEWLAFTGTISSQGKPAETSTDLFLVRSNGSGLRRLASTGSANAPAWSPDGRTLVFSELRRDAGTGLISDSAAPLMAVESDGSNLRELTPQVRGQADVPGSFSPDGAHLAFTRYDLAVLEHGGQLEPSIETVNPDGSDPQTLIAEGSDPAYSPDGSRIAFVSNRDHNGILRTGEDESAYAEDLYVANADGTAVRRLTHTAKLSESDPTWSPRGAAIAFDRQAEGFTKTIAVINANGSCAHQIAGDPAERVWYEAPAWRPAGSAAFENAMRCPPGHRHLPGPRGR